MSLSQFVLNTASIERFLQMTFNEIDMAIEALRKILKARFSAFPEAAKERRVNSSLEQVLKRLQSTKSDQTRLIFTILVAEKFTELAQSRRQLVDLDNALFRLGMHFWRLAKLSDIASHERSCAAEISLSLLGATKTPPKPEIDALKLLMNETSSLESTWLKMSGLNASDFYSCVYDLRRVLTTESVGTYPSVLLDVPTDSDRGLRYPTWIKISQKDQGDKFKEAQNPWPSDANVEFANSDIDLARRIADSLLNDDFQFADQYANCLIHRLGNTWSPSRSFEDGQTWRMIRAARHLAKIEDPVAHVRRQNALSAYELLSGLNFVEDLVKSLAPISVENLDPESPEGRSEWSVTMARLLSVGEHEDLGFQISPELRGALRENLSSFTNLISKSEIRTFSDLAHLLKGLRREIETDLVNSQSTELLNAFLRWYKRVLHLLLPYERNFLEQTESLVREMAKASKLTDSTTRIASILGISERVEILVEAVRRSSSSFVQELALPVLTIVREQVNEAKKTAEQVSRPDLRISLQSSKLPLRSILNEEISLIIEVLNIGNASAKDIYLSMSCSEAEIVRNNCALDVLRAKETSVKTLSFKMDKPVPQLIFVFEFSWTDDFNQKFSERLNLVAESESESSWSHSDVNPYALEPVKKRNRLFGRDKELESLEARLSAGNSVFITGQKRVGKSSLVQVALDALQRKGVATTLLPFGYLQSDSVNGLIGNLLSTIDGALGSLPDIRLPQVPDFKAGVTPLIAGQWLKAVTECVGDKPRLTLAIDDFDELPSRFFETEEGASFFVFLRALISEPWFALVLIGSEIMPSLMSRHGYKLNVVGQIDIGKLNEPEATGQLLREPSSQWLEWSDGAIRSAHQLSGGNPYFATLLAQDVWDNHRELDRSFVHETDVRASAERFARGEEQYHIVHLWADGANGINPESDLAIQNAVTLFAVSKCALDNDAARRDEVIDFAVFRLGNSGPELYKDRLEKLVERRVLTRVGDHSITFEIPIVQRWFKESAPRVLASQIRVLTEAIRESGYIADREYVDVSEGLNFNGKNISETKVKAWVAQFPEVTQRVAAFRMLQRLKSESYFDEKVVTTFGEEFRAKLAELTINKRIRSNKGYISNAKILCPFLHDVQLAKNMATGLRIAKEHVGFISDFENNNVQFANCGVLIVFTSFDGTGVEVKELVSRVLKDNRLNVDCPEILIITLASLESDEHLTVAGTDFPRLVGKHLDSRLRPFGIVNSPIGDSENVIQLRDKFKKMGEMLVARFPLGWPIDGLLLLFSSFKPTFLPPFFTFSGRYLGQEWLPLFEGGDEWAGEWPKVSDPQEDDVLELLRPGLENSVLEFKSSMYMSFPDGEHMPGLSEVVLKVVASFLNADGGKLLIGVNDEGKIVGLEADYQFTGGPDKFGLKMSDLLNSLDGYAPGLVEHRPISLGEGNIYIVECTRSKKPIFLKKGSETIFYVREGARSAPLSGNKMADYLKARFQ